MKKQIKCIVSVSNANGSPDFHLVRVNCTQEQYDNGEHYDAAKDDAEEKGYDAYLAYDHNDDGFSMFKGQNWKEVGAVEI